MKKLNAVLVLLFVCSFLISGEPLGASAISDSSDPIGSSPSALAAAEFVPNEVLVRFKSQVTISRGPSGRPSTNLSSVNALIQRYGVTSSDRVFKDAKKPPTGASIRVNGKLQSTPDLTNIHKLRLPQNSSVQTVVAAFKADPNVEYAEPNYIARMTDVPNDPSYGQQWGVPAIHAEEAWTITKGSPAVTIAILDTGVDMNHPDLVGKFWTNPGEIPGNGIDDDGNGYTDDVNGYDFVNLDNNPQDDNGHGTHVAGISAAASNNGVGVAGVCWNCKIMPLKVLQSSGRGSYSDIAAAVNYASNKGAKVINMSLGGYGDSAVLRDALAAAYPTSVLVAAAGNDGNPISHAPFFPAAYSFVIGVEATDSDGSQAAFSNYDDDGPTHSGYTEGYNYSIRAPGVSIYSTMFDDTYASYSGTSMAAPFVAGAAGLVVTQNPTWSKEKIRAQLSQSASGASDSSTGLLNIYSALTMTLPPNLKLGSSIAVGDATGDNDGKVDAGETITLTTTLKNYGASEATGVVATLSLVYGDGFVTITTPSSNFGDISAFATNNNASNPFAFSVSSTAPNNHDIVFELNVTANGGSYAGDLGTFTLTVQRGQQLGGVLTSDTTLTADKYYIVTSPILVSSGVTLTIQPGTTLAFAPGACLQVEGTLVAIGNPDSPILFTSNQLSKAAYDWGGCSDAGIRLMSSATFDASGNYVSGSILKYAIVEYSARAVMFQGSAPFIDHNVIRYNGSGYGAIYGYGNVSNRTKITNNRIYGNAEGLAVGSYTDTSNNVIFGNSVGVYIGMRLYSTFERNVVTGNGGQGGVTHGGSTYGPGPVALSGGNSLYANNAPYEVYMPVSQPNIDATNNWWGTTDSATIAQRIYDYNDNFNAAHVYYTPFLLAPDPNAPPILYTAAISPSGIVGAGSATFTLTFSRPMSQTVQPSVAFGVTSPYTQHPVSGSWTNSTTWVGAFSVNVTTGDGINTIHVTSAKDLEGTEIPTDQRFQFTIQTAGSSSLSLNATPGYSQVRLNWDSSPLSYTLGYNVYRGITNTVPYTSTPINGILVTTPLYMDNAVTNGTQYFYKYAIVDTDLREVAFSNEVSATPNDFTAPTTPVVTDDGSCTNSTTTLHARWSASDPESGIAAYQYGIGTLPGSADVINWTSAGLATEVTRTGLNLTNGSTYYFTVKSKNGVGTWSSAGNSDGIVVDNTCKYSVTVSLKNAPNPSTFGQAVVFTATVTSSGGIPTGIVAFRDDATVFGTGALNASGIATTSVTTLTVGAHNNITAQYPGDANFIGSTSAGITQTVKYSVTVSLTASPSPLVAGKPITLTATVTQNTGSAPARTGRSPSSTPSGNITFKDGQTTLGTVPLNNGVAMLTTTLTAGSHSLSAQYSGDSGYGAGVATISVSVNQGTQYPFFLPLIQK